MEEGEGKGSCLAINFRGSSKRRYNRENPNQEQKMSLLKDSEPAGFRVTAWTTSTVNSEEDELFGADPFNRMKVTDHMAVTPESLSTMDRPSNGRRRRSSVYEGEQEPRGVRGQEAMVTPEDLLRPPAPSGGSRRRRSSVYAGEQEPKGVRGQEAILTPEPNPDPYPPTSSAARRYRESLHTGEQKPLGTREEETPSPDRLLNLPITPVGSRRRRSAVYEGEMEPNGVRGQEARVNESRSVGANGIPSMRSFSPEEQGQKDRAASMRKFPAGETTPTFRRRDIPIKDEDDTVRSSFLDLLPVTETSIPEGEEWSQGSESSEDMQPLMRDFKSPTTTEAVLHDLGQMRSPESARNPRRYRQPSPGKRGESLGSSTAVLSVKPSGTPMDSGREQSPRMPSMRSSIDSARDASSSSSDSAHSSSRSSIDFIDNASPPISMRSSIDTPPQEHEPRRMPSMRSSIDSAPSESRQMQSMRSSIDSTIKAAARSQYANAASESSNDLRQMMPDLIPKSSSSQRKSAPVKINNARYANAMQHVEWTNASAVAHVENGEYDLALAAFEQVLEAYREMYGETHPLVASTYHNLGMVHSKRAALLLDGTFHQNHCRQQSLECFQAAARTGRDSLGRNHPNVAVSLVRIGFLLLQARQYHNAFVTFKEALRIRIEHYGTDVPNSLVANLYNNLGVCKMHLGQYKEGSSLLTTALDIQRKVLRSKRQEADVSRGELRNCLLEVADTLCNLGGLYLEWIRQQGPDSRHFAEAEAAFAEALEIRTTVLGPSHALVHQVRTLHEMALVPIPNPKRRSNTPRSPESMESTKPDPTQKQKNVPTVGSPALGDPNEASVSMLSEFSTANSSAERPPPPGAGRRASSFPFVEITVDSNDFSDGDSFEGDIAPSNSADTKMKEAPHSMPQASSAVKPQNESFQSDAAEFLLPTMLDSSASESSSTSPIHLLQGLRDLGVESAGTNVQGQSYVNYAEESCMMRDGGGRATSLFLSMLEREEEFAGENSRTLFSHEIMVARPLFDGDDSFTRDIPPGSMQTASWSRAVRNGGRAGGNGEVKQSGGPYYDSPTMKLKEEISDLGTSREMHSMADANEDGLAPLGGDWATSTDSTKGLTKEILDSPDEHLGLIYDAAGRYLKRKQYPEALHLFQTIVDCQRKLHGELDADVGAAYHNVGVACLRAERHEKALDAFQKAVRVRKGALGKNHPEVAVSLVKVGISQVLLHNFEFALVAFRDALCIRCHSLGVLHPSTARVYNNIGCVHIKLNELRDARRAFEAALDIQRNAIGQEPSSAPLLFGAATTLCNLGYLYKYRGMPERAALVLAEALNIQERILGPNHQTVLSTMVSLADASAQSGNGLMALRCYGEILDRFRATHSREDENAQRLGTQAVLLLYKMSQAHHQLNDRESELEKLEMALEAIRSIDDESMTAEDAEAIRRFDALMVKDIGRVHAEIEKTEMDWL